MPNTTINGTFSATINNTNGGNNMPNTTTTFSLQDLANAVAQLNNSNGNGTQVQGNGRAIHSQFYNQIMNDGQLYNPYLVRRWLPAQFLRLMRQSRELNVDAEIKKSYTLKYSMEWLASECEKLGWLYKHDRVAYNERKNFLTMQTVKEMTRFYADSVESQIVNARIARTVEKNGKLYEYIHVKGLGWFSRGYKKFETDAYGNVTSKLILSDEAKQRINKAKYLADEFNYVRNHTYKEAGEILKGFKFANLHKANGLSPAFVHAFKKAGAYYTLKNLILFEGVQFHSDDRICDNSIDSANALKDILNRESYVVYAILKKSIRDARYDIGTPSRRRSF